MKIEINGLLKEYGSLTAVDGIDLEFEEGELTTLVGPSGCGKTTTLRCIAGLERPEGGRITIGDQVATDPSEDILVPTQERDIGFIFQSFKVWPHMSVFENVAYPLRIRDFPDDEIEDRVMEKLEMTNIEDLAEKNATNLSGGQQTRVSICRALVSEPDLLLCDEPLTGLDRNLRKSMRVEIKRIQRELDITTVYVTHSQPEAMILSDKICLLNTDGKIEQAGPSEELYNNPTSPYVFEFFGGEHRLAGTVSESGVVSTELGDFTADTSQFSNGDYVEVGFRPRDIELRPTNEVTDTDGLIEGSVDLINFRGDFYEIEISVDGQTITAQATNGNQLSTGERVYLNVPSSHIHVFGGA